MRLTRVGPGNVFALKTIATIIVLGGPDDDYLWRCLVIDHTGEASREWQVLTYTYSFLNEKCDVVA